MSSNVVDVSKLTFEMTKKLNYYLDMLIERGGSDLHIKSNSNIRGRVNGKIIILSDEILSHPDSVTLAKELLRARFQRFVEEKNLDFTYRLNDDYRFRVNIFFQIDGVSAVFRTIPTTLPTLQSLNLPEQVHKFCAQPRGLILVTGPTGSGKTTTLAAMINSINKEFSKHILTVEDPVEYVYKDEKSIINQRAIGQDATNFADSLKAALREDPDVILVGEMRDLETIETAMHAAETGHLVLSTLHTIDAKETVGRILGMFPGNDQNRIRMTLASTLQGIISQRLVRTKTGGRTAALEILVKNARIESLILDGRDGDITDAVKEGKDVYKSQTFDQSLLDLYISGAITKEEALSNATSSNNLAMSIDYYDSGRDSSMLNKEQADKDIIALKV